MGNEIGALHYIELPFWGVSFSVRIQLLPFSQITGKLPEGPIRNSSKELCGCFVFVFLGFVLHLQWTSVKASGLLNT